MKRLGFTFALGLTGLIALGQLSGCQSDTHDTKIPAKVRGPKVAPKYQETPIDPDLQASARKLLMNETNNADPFLRGNAIEALSDVDPNDAVGPVIQGLADPEANVRFASAIAAGQLRLDAAYQVLLSMTNDKDPRVRIGVIFALHRLGDTRLSHSLETYAADIHPSIRGTVAMVLGLLGDKSAIPMLTTLLHDQHPTVVGIPGNAAEVRLQAAESLWRLGDENGLKDLASFAISGYPDDQIVALQALAEPGDQRVLGQVLEEVAGDRPEVTLAAARACGMLGSDAGWYPVLDGAKSSDPRQRSLAALAMGAIGRPDLQPYLRDLMRDSEIPVRIAAATAILQLKVHPPSASEG